MSRQQMDRPFHFIGERLWLDFVNTEVVEGGLPVDLLEGFDDLARWSVSAGVIATKQADDLLRRWRGTREAERTFAQAIQFRASLRKMAERMAAGRGGVEQAALDGINVLLRTRAGELAVVRTKEGYETQFRRQFTVPAHLLVPVAESAADFLGTGDLGLVRKCQNPTCVLYFHDTTKNHARRWCSMTACGNRAKVAAHYRRNRRDAPP